MKKILIITLTVLMVFSLCAVSVLAVTEGEVQSQVAAQGKEKVTVSFGCTGGHHRSVTFALLLCDELKKAGYSAECFHRDIKIKD